MEYRKEIGLQRALSQNRGRIPIDDFHKSASEGEGACSRTSAGRFHLPLRGKLGWMTPRTRSKKGRETECVFRGFLFPSKSPYFFVRQLFLSAFAKASPGL